MSNLTHTANALLTYVTNEGKLYKNQILPLQERLARAKVAGTYDREKALKGFSAIVTEGGRMYRREFSGDAGFDASDKAAAAREMLNSFEGEYELGNMEHVGGAARKKSPAQLQREIDEMEAQGANRRNPYLAPEVRFAGTSLAPTPAIVNTAKVAAKVAAKMETLFGKKGRK